jgi:hypothetical protein
MLSIFLPYLVLGMLLFSIAMIFSKMVVGKVIVIIGLVLYNFLIPHFRIIIPNYYVMRDWIAICGGLVYLIAVENR